MPLIAAVSLVQCVAAGVQVHSLVVSLRGSVLERCWIDTSLGVLPQLVSIELEIVYPWLLVLQWHVEQLLWILDIALVPLFHFACHSGFQSLASVLSRHMCASNSSS